MHPSNNLLQVAPAGRKMSQSSSPVPYDISWIQKDTRCWIYQPQEHDGDIYLRGIIKAVVPLSINKANSRVSGVLDNGSSFETKAHQLEKCRDSMSIEKDLIEMDIINAPEVLLQLKRRLGKQRIHTCLWNSLIIVNPFQLIQGSYSEQALQQQFEHHFMRGEDIRQQQPHIFSFIFHIMAGLESSHKAQVISISGQSGSGKTETNKQALRAIAYCCSRVQQIRKEVTNDIRLENRVLNCDPILEVFGNAKTVKNDNSSRFGKLVTLRLNGSSLKIYHSAIKNYFLEKSRIISQSNGERNFHIFYQLVAYGSEELKHSLKLYREGGGALQLDDFHYLTQRGVPDKQIQPNDKQMWDALNQAFTSLEFSKQTVHEIYSIVAAVLLLGNVNFESGLDNESCEVRDTYISDNIANLLGLKPAVFAQALTKHHRVVAGQSILSELNEKRCIEGRDSMAKAIYESLFQWLVETLNSKLNADVGQQSEVRLIKLLDIYGFEVFEENSFEQLCVNYTNEKIHQIYLEQVFIHEKNTLRKEGLQSIISSLNFTDNAKIIELLDTYNRSVFNLLDQSCSFPVKDDDFLQNVRKHHDSHPHFPPSNNVNTRKTFIINHTPGDIEYTAQGFRDKNQDLIREDILLHLSKSKLQIISHSFKERSEALKQESNKRFLGVKIRKQVKELMLEMSTNSDLHFIRCIKPNEEKAPFRFVDRVCYNQIRYLGILDTIQMRKDTYHIRTPYPRFYQKYGILEKKLPYLIELQNGTLSPHECKEITMQFMANTFVNYQLDYQFGRDRIFLKMSTQNVLDQLLKRKTKYIEFASTAIKAHFKRYKMVNRREDLRYNTRMIQTAVRSYLRVIKVVKRRKAARLIEATWIEQRQTFLNRKHRPLLMKLQKYIKAKVGKEYSRQKIESIRKSKSVMMSLGQTHKLTRYMEMYSSMKQQFLGPIYSTIWERMRIEYLRRIKQYIKAGMTFAANTDKLSEADERTNFRLNIKYRRSLETYILAGHWRRHFLQQRKAILTIQAHIRRFRPRRAMNELRRSAIMIQRNWRKYYYDKQYSLEYTQVHFEAARQDGIAAESSYWRRVLHRDYNRSSKTREGGVDKAIWNQERVRIEKMGLFYYLLDFQILTPLGQIYPQNSWVDNYCSIYEHCMSRGNPLQIVEVGSDHTACATLNKVYTWGQLPLQTLVQPTVQQIRNVETLKLPPGRLERVTACNRATVVEVEHEEPTIIGPVDGQGLELANKQWRTLNQTYVIINGAVLTLKKAQFSRVPLNEKVSQLSCGMGHCIAKTSLRKVFTWGDNTRGQLGQGHFKRILKPRIVDVQTKLALTVQQVAASAYGSVILDVYGRIWWWGENGTIEATPQPTQCLLYQKSQFLDNPHRYGVVRILPSWSKSISLIGVTIGTHQGIFKSSQNSIKRKTYQTLMSKWNEDNIKSTRKSVYSVTPPYVQSISGYFQQKLMPKSRQVDKPKDYEAEHQRIKEKLLKEIQMMEEAERTLLRHKKNY